MNTKETREYISLLFEGYKKRKLENRLYKHEDIVPKIIITGYINLVEKPEFSDLIDNYKRQYIFCESRVEENIEPELQEGLGLVYDYICDFNFETDKFNVFSTSLLIHSKLYSKCTDKSFGGLLRNHTAYLTDVNIEVPEPEEAKRIFNSYIPKGDFLAKEFNNKSIFEYIKDCIKLNVELIKLQPFNDGNKRTFRALTNLLLKRLSIPPIYIEIHERDEYKKALIKAMKNENSNSYDDLIQFYYYKICDAIVTLDIKSSKMMKSGKQKK